jgi:hypothetical protein
LGRDIDLELKGATWWEALDETARAAQARYEFIRREDGGYELRLEPGRDSNSPALYIEQFRLSVAETKRLEFKAPDRRGEVGLIVVELRYQPDLRPQGRSFMGAVRVASIRDAKGENVEVEGPSWAVNRKFNGRSLGLQDEAWVRTDAALPLTIRGTTDVQFAMETKEVSLELQGEKSQVVIGKTKLSVAGFSQFNACTKLKLRADPQDGSERLDGLVDGMAIIEDSEGKRYKRKCTLTFESPYTCDWEFEFPGEIKEPRRVLIRWITQYHRVEIPFRLEGVRLP